MGADYDVSTWTFGAEHEFADWSRATPLVEGVTLDTGDFTIMNSDGSAIDGKGIRTRHGGEFCTAPSDIAGQIDQFIAILARHRDIRMNNRAGGMHIHVRVPGLHEDLESLKKIQKYVHSEPGWPMKLDPVLPPTMVRYKNQDEYDGAMKRYRRLLRSHHAMVTPWRVANQMKAQTVEEFFEAEVVTDDGDLMWNSQRSCVNLRHLRQTETIEFRHFFSTMNPNLVGQAFIWCRNFLMEALKPENVQEPISFLLNCREFDSPAEVPYIHWQELRFESTKAGNPEREDNYYKIREGTHPYGPPVMGWELREWPFERLASWGQ